jgi:DNA-binding transcriptional ArsR family regulator
MVTYNREALFDALADGTRREILDLLAHGEHSAGDLADRFPVSRPAISRHLKVLRDAGLVQQRKEAQWRVYRLNPEALREIDRWLDAYRVFWAARLQNLKRFVESSDD